MCIFHIIRGVCEPTWCLCTIGTVHIAPPWKESCTKEPWTGNQLPLWQPKWKPFVSLAYFCYQQRLVVARKGLCPLLQVCQHEAERRCARMRPRVSGECKHCAQAKLGKVALLVPAMCTRLHTVIGPSLGVFAPLALYILHHHGKNPVQRSPGQETSCHCGSPSGNLLFPWPTFATSKGWW